MHARLPWLLLVAALLPVLVAGDEKPWRPYAFKGTETFKYAVEREGEDRVAGTYEIVMAKAGDKYKISLKGELGDSAGSFSTTTSKAEDLPGLVLTQAFMNPWVAPLAVTVFTPALAGYAAQSSWEVGAKWSRTQDGETVTLEVPETCSYAGREGKLIRMTKNGDVGYEGCIDTSVALPLYAYMTDGKGAYKATLTSYAE